MPRPFWGPFWVPFWDPFWDPFRNGAPFIAQNPCTAGISKDACRTRQGNGLRNRVGGGTAGAGGRRRGRRLALLGDRWSHARPQRPYGACKGVW